MLKFDVPYKRIPFFIYFLLVFALKEIGLELFKCLILISNKYEY